MARADALLTAVQRIHEAALEPDGWTAALPPIGDAFRSEHAILFSLNIAHRHVDSIIGYNMAPELLARFAALVEGDHLPRQLFAIPSGTAVRYSSVHPDREFARSVVYNEVIRPIGAFHGTAATLLRTPARQVNFSVGRTRGKEDYDAEDLAAMNAIVPHLVTATRVNERLEAADLYAAGACAALDRLSVGVILVDAAARILFANRLADAVLAVCDGLTIDKDGLRTSDPNTARTLRRLISDCAEISRINGGPGGSVKIPRVASRAPLHVLVAPVRSETDRAEMAWLGAARPAAILIITDPEREGRERWEDLRRRFGLTNAEADVALEILKGDGRDAVAARLGISMPTVRTHLGHIFEKTGARRQAELVRLLMQGD